MRGFEYTAAALAAALTVAAMPAMAQTPDPSTAATAVDANAMAALVRMGAYLRTLKSFEVKATTSTEYVLADGQKSARDGSTHLVARMPDRLRINVTSDRQDRLYLYNGKEFTLFAQRLGYYAVVPAPATVRQVADQLYDKYGIAVPLEDLFLWGSPGWSTSAISAASDLGPSQIDGTTCQHYGFRQDGLDWQIWIQKGDSPLPRKLLMTTTTDAARPQHTAVYAWNLAPSFNDAAFTFVPPSDAHKIVLAEQDAASANASK
jgi:hypothetical protein